MRFSTIRFRAEDSVEHDINTDAGFAARQAEKLGREISPEYQERLDTQDRNVSTALEFESESPQPKRDDQGRFAGVVNRSRLVASVLVDIAARIKQ